MKTRLFLLINLLLGVSLQAQDTATPKTLLWKIEGKGMASPSFLYGTMHTSDDRVFHLTDSTMTYFKQATNFAMEINMDSVRPLELVNEIRLEGDQTLKDLLTEEDYKVTAKYFRKRTGYPLFLMNKVKPLYIWLMMQEGKPEKKKKANDALDMYFFKLAQKQNKTVFGLEKAEDQLALLHDIPISRQVEMLKEGVQSLEKGEEPIGDVYASYVDADLDKMLQEAQADTSMGADFMDRLLNRRNVGMANKIDVLMKKGSLFVAVGAAHLPGEEGVINLLRQKGYTVSPVFSDNRLDLKKVKAEVK